MNYIELTHEGLTVIIRSTKTRKSGIPHILQVLRSMDNLHVDVNSVTLLTSTPVVASMRKALQGVHLSSARKVSFHSLRRGGAQLAARKGSNK